MKINSLICKTTSGVAKIGVFLTVICGVGLVDAAVWVPFFGCFATAHVVAKHVVGYRLDPAWEESDWEDLKAISWAEAEIAHRWP